VGAALRVVLYFGFATPPRTATALARALATGLLYDTLVAALTLAPLAVILALFRLRVLERPVARGALLGALSTGLAFSACVEWFYFDEFDARFNHIALDYIRHPGEVIGNIWESYNVVLFVGAAVLLGAVAGWAGARFTRGASFPRRTARQRLRAAALVLAVATVSGAVLAVLPGEVSHDRILSEIGQNGLDRLVHAFRTGRVEYDLYYKSLPKGLARRRAAGVLGFPSVSPGEAESAAYHVIRGGTADSKPRPWDVVVIVEESFGSEFVGVLGHPERKTTPGFDRWSREGLLLTNLTSTGTRTVRGLEGTLCSLVPLPGEEVLKRKNPGGVATLASVFRHAGYDTTFVYGGWGRFDGMKPFFPDNGFDEFIERDAYPKDAFSTIWGVADEWILAKVLERQKQAEADGRHLFLTALTVSNHRPFDVPERGTSWPAHMRTRETGVAYADWALADYLDKAKAAGLLDHTIVLVEGDHGARVYGAEEIPAASYRIPGLILVPDGAWRGRRLTRVCSQIDLAPTLLALLGRPIPAPFLGADLTHLPEDGGRAFLQHNRDVGLLTDRAMVVLGLEKTVTCYARSGRDSDAWQRLSACASRPDFQSLGDDAASVYETADDLLRRGVFTLPDAGGVLAANPAQSSR
jgi:arylsulfatase A-like enzyme